jgi:hypothetical protein
MAGVRAQKKEGGFYKEHYMQLGVSACGSKRSMMGWKPGLSIAALAQKSRHLKCVCARGVYKFRDVTPTTHGNR